MVSPVAAMELRARSTSCSMDQSSTATPTMGQSRRPRASSRYSDRKVITRARSPVIPKTTRTSPGRGSLLSMLGAMPDSPSLTGHDADPPARPDPPGGVIPTGSAPGVGHAVDDSGHRQDQARLDAGLDLDAVGVGDPEPLLGDLGDLVAVALDLVLVVDDVALGLQV